MSPSKVEVPSGEIQDNSYVEGGEIPVQKDPAPVEDPIDPKTADTDAQLDRDDRDAIDKSNILEERTRGATKDPSVNREPGDEEGLPGPEDGTSAMKTSAVSK